LPPVTVPHAVPREHAECWSKLEVSLRWHERLHAFVVGEGAVFVLVDTNSDGREIELRIYVKASDETRALAVELDDAGIATGSVAGRYFESPSDSGSATRR
jgi:hypothetical protein